MEQEDKNYVKRWGKLAKELSECADVMPESLTKHQERVYDACLDMAYNFDQTLKEITEEVKGNYKDEGHAILGPNGDYGLSESNAFKAGFNYALTKTAEIINSKQ